MFTLCTAVALLVIFIGVNDIREKPLVFRVSPLGLMLTFTLSIVLEIIYRKITHYKSSMYPGVEELGPFVVWVIVLLYFILKQAITGRAFGVNSNLKTTPRSLYDVVGTTLIVLLLLFFLIPTLIYLTLAYL